MTEQYQRPTGGSRQEWKEYWAAIGMPWRTEPEIDTDRQHYLSTRRAVQPDVEKGIYPFRDENGSIRLTRADVEWLVTTDEARQGLDDSQANVLWEYRKKVDLRGADLRGVNLTWVQLMAIRGGIEADTWDSLSASQRDMAATHFEGANLSRARLEGSSLRFAHLEGADLRLAHLDGVTLRGAHLAGADLRGAYCDRVTVLTGVDFGDDQRGSVKVDNAHWGQANMSVVDWTRLGMLGDEQLARTRRMPDGKLKSRALRIEELEAAVRANRQLAAALDAQGVSTAADHFAYRAQFLQQQVLRRRRKFGAYFFSRILDGLAGYGYKPIRGLIAYILVIVGFAFAYGLATHGVLTFGLPRSQIQPLQWYEALVLSISSFHGRGFFQPVQSLGDPVAIIAAVEAIIGLVIEVSFIATFTQRFFGK